MKKYLCTFVSALLAGICISLGGSVFLSLKDAFVGGNVVGALLFTIGLFVICTRGYHLFTGKVCYLFDNKPSYIIELAVVWLGNLIGCCGCSALINLTRIGNLGETAKAMVETKMSDSYLSLFILGFFCNIFIFIAANGYANNPHELGKYLSLFLGVSIFILCGTEHSIADMFYWSVSGVMYTSPLKSFICLLIITLGNAAGGVTFPLLEKLKQRLSK